MAPRLSSDSLLSFYTSPWAPLFDSSVYINVIREKNELRGYCCWAFPEFPRILFDLIIGAANRQGAHSVYLEREFKMAVGGLGRRRRRMNKARVLIGPAAERDGGSPSRRLHHALTIFPFFFFNNILFKIYLYIYSRREGGEKRRRRETGAD